MAAERFVRAANSSALPRPRAAPPRPRPAPAAPPAPRVLSACRGPACRCPPVSASPVPACPCPSRPARPGRSPPLPAPARPFQRRPADGSAGPLLRARRGPRRFLPQRQSQILPGAHVYRNKCPRLVLNDLYRCEGRGGERKNRAPVSRESCSRGARRPEGEGGGERAALPRPPQLSSGAPPPLWRCWPGSAGPRRALRDQAGRRPSL